MEPNANTGTVRLGQGSIIRCRLVKPGGSFACPVSGKYPWAVFSPQGPSMGELAVQALSSVEGGYDLLAPKFDCTPFRTSDGVLDATAARCARSARSAGDWTCAAAPARACGSSGPCARNRSPASISALACSRRRAARTRTPDGCGPMSGPCPSPGSSTWRLVSGRLGTSCPPNDPRYSPACTARCGLAGCSLSQPRRRRPSPQAGTGHCSGRSGHAGS